MATGVRALAAAAACAFCAFSILYAIVVTAPTLAPATDPAGPGGGPPLALSGYHPSGEPQVPSEAPEASANPTDTTGTHGSQDTRSDIVSGLTGTGIPYVALRAYKAAAQNLARTDPGCGLDWALLAAIGRVESDHGRYGGAALRANGTVTTPIYGPALRIGDSDGGQLDGDVRADRAVGPMQFLPGTWSAFGVDGSGDGRADPQNIADAALSAGRYLCADGADLSNDPGAAVFRYNHSAEYVSLVLSLAESYRSGDNPQLLAVGGGHTGARTSDASHRRHAGPSKASHRHHSPGHHQAKSPGHPGHHHHGPGHGNDQGKGNADPPKSPSPTRTRSHTPPGSPSGSGTDTPSGSPSKSRTDSPSPSESATPSGSPTQCASPTLSASQSSKPTPTATPSPTTCTTDQSEPTKAPHNEP